MGRPPIMPPTPVKHRAASNSFCPGRARSGTEWFTTKPGDVSLLPSALLSAVIWIRFLLTASFFIYPLLSRSQKVTNETPEALVAAQSQAFPGLVAASLLSSSMALQRREDPVSTLAKEPTMDQPISKFLLLSHANYTRSVIESHGRYNSSGYQWSVGSGWHALSADPEALLAASPAHTVPRTRTSWCIQADQPPCIAVLPLPLLRLSWIRPCCGIFLPIALFH